LGLIVEIQASAVVRNSNVEFMLGKRRAAVVKEPWAVTWQLD